MGAVAWGGVALADKPHDWELNLQKAASPIMERVHSFHTLLLYIIFVVAGFVLVLLLWVIFRYNARINPTPSRTTHNTLIEVVWTVVPILILVVIAVPSFRLLYFANKAPAENDAQGITGAVITIKVQGHQWYWSYVYEASYQVDGKGFAVKKDGKPLDALAGAHFKFDSHSACIGDGSDAKSCDDFAKANGRKPIRLLDVDNPVVIPEKTTVRLLIEGMDVIHSFALPSMGIKLDANPGRINETWVRAERVGWYYGQCSELCGTNHGFMPIAVRVVTRDEYNKWLAGAKSNPLFDKVEEPKRADAQPQ
jgi:cytochrome c oxidase subunit 2